MWLNMNHPNVLNDWLEECAELERFALTPVADLFPSWDAWATERWGKGCSRKLFSMALKRHGFTCFHANTGSAYEGLRLKRNMTP
jgi:hypothetical protein